MSHDMDFYQILGVTPNATYEEIRSAYRKLARQYHPDLNPGMVYAEERFKLINVAYEILKNEDRRKKYDFFRHYGIPTPNPFARNPTEVDLENLINLYVQELDKFFKEIRDQIRRYVSNVIESPFRWINRAVKTIGKWFSDTKPK